MATQKPSGCPLYLHRSGQWAKKVKGKLYYFGKDLPKALARWNEERHALLAGSLPPSRDKSNPTISELGNVFIAHYREEAANGQRGNKHIDLCIDSIERMCEAVGDRQACDLSPADFAVIKKHFFTPVPRTKTIRGGVVGPTVERRSPNTVAGEVRRIRRFLTWCHRRELIPPPRYGESFSPTTKTAATKDSTKKPRDLSPCEARAIVEAAGIRFKPLTLLGLNAGIGNRDIAEMLLADIDLSSEEVWVDLPRLKTGQDRRFVLWPETAKAIRNYLDCRPNPKPGYEDRLFLTRTGAPWMLGDGHGAKDSIGTTFTKVRAKAGVTGKTFYDLRRTFQTVANGTLDFPAVKHVMGHASESRDMSALYTQQISDSRIRSVCEFVRGWYLGTVACD